MNVNEQHRQSCVKKAAIHHIKTEFHRSQKYNQSYKAKPTTGRAFGGAHVPPTKVIRCLSE